MRARLSGARFVAAGLLLLAAMSIPTRADADDTYRVVYLSSMSMPGYCMRHANFLGELSYCGNPVGSLNQISPPPTNPDFIFKMRRALVNDLPGVDWGGWSYESMNFPGWYLRHENFRIKLAPKPAPNDPAFRQFAEDASFLAPARVSYNFPTLGIVHSNFHLYLGSDSSPHYNSSDWVAWWGWYIEKPICPLCPHEPIPTVLPS
jgi:hypothetical protein